MTITAERTSPLSSYRIKIRLKYQEGKLAIVDEMAEGRLVGEFDLGADGRDSQAWRIGKWSQHYRGKQLGDTGVGIGLVQFVPADAVHGKAESRKEIWLDCGEGLSP